MVDKYKMFLKILSIKISLVNHIHLSYSQKLIKKIVSPGDNVAPLWPLSYAIDKVGRRMNRNE